MSRYFDKGEERRCLELVERARDSVAVQPPSRGTTRSTPNVSIRYAQRVVDAPEQISAAGLWRIIRDRKWTITTFTLVVVAIVLTASFLMKPQYDAVARVVFHRENDSGVLGFKGVDTPLLEDPQDLTAIDTQIGILESDALAMQVINDLHLDKNPNFAGRARQSGNEDRLVKSFHNSLSISKVKGTRLLEIRFRNTDPRLAADIVNDLAKAHVDRYYRSQLEAGTQMSEFLVNQLKELQAKVEESQQKLVDYQKENGISGLDEKQNIVTAKLDDLNRELTAAEADRVRKEVDYRLARSGQAELIAKLESDNLITRLRGQQAELEDQMAQASVQLGPAHPKIAELSNQLFQVRQSIDAEVRRIGERITYEYKSAVGRERMLQHALEAQKQAADELNANAIQYNMLKHEFETNRKLYEDLLQKQKEVAISASLKSSDISVVDPARPPKLPAEPKILLNFVLSLLCGIFGGVLLAFGLAKMNEKISTLEQMLALSPLPSLGVLPLLKAKSKNGALPELKGVKGDWKPELVSFLQPLSLAAESYRAILTSILLSQPTPPGVILVTSALPGEGKTTVSTNLAIVLARLRRRVLLVDADLRRPSIQRAMGLSTTTGLGALLRKSAAFDEAVVGCADVPNLFILPAGRINLPDDNELLVSGFKHLTERWREKFDHIIIDTPPVLPMTDAVRMAVEADSVVLVIRSGQIAKDAFLRAQDLLLQVNARLTGFVLNGADLSSSDFQYYYGYYSQDEAKRLGKGA
jgi:polysaccharide biosynthesis transport protein